jgi:hypothetical protein
MKDEIAAWMSEYANTLPLLQRAGLQASPCEAASDGIAHQVIVEACASHGSRQPIWVTIDHTELTLDPKKNLSLITDRLRARLAHV